MAPTVHYASLADHPETRLGPTEWMKISQHRIALFADATLAD